jgi:chromosome segregation ATPase
MSKEHLATYLNDHLAGSLIAVEIMEHLETEASDLMPDLAALKSDIEADRDQLRTLMDRLHIPESRVRKVTSWIAEQVTEAKFEADDETRGTLRRLERLEALAVGIDGKSALWRALNAAAEGAPELRGMDYEHLTERAQKQRNRVEILRLQAARLALAPLP